MLTKIKSVNKRNSNGKFSKENKPSELINMFFHNIRNISFIKDQNLRYIEVNDSFEKMFGLNRAKVIGKTDFELFDQNNAGTIRDNDKKVISSGEKIEVEEIYITKSTSLLLKLNKFPLLDDHGSVIGIGAIGSDVTSQILENEEVERKRLKILSIIAHDLKNPFNSILGIANLLKTNLSEFSFPEIQKLVSVLDNSSRKAVDLFENMLKWTISNWKDDCIVREEVNLKSFVGETLKPLSLSADDKKINIMNHIGENTIISIDKNIIGAVIRNLVSNSIKFTNSGGSIIVESVQTEDTVEIIISDNGVGMSEEKIQSLFSNDNHESNIGTFNEKGVGLGLIVCKDFVEKNGGRIWAENKTQGSEFHFTIPIE